MKKELNNSELNEVVGGTIIISEDYNNIGFTKLGEMYDLKVDYYTARNYVEELKRENKTMSNAAFDALCKSKLLELDWI
jgi:bacteriocin-like protein